MTQPEVRALKNAQPATRYVAPSGEVLAIAQAVAQNSDGRMKRTVRKFQARQRKENYE